MKKRKQKPVKNKECRNCGKKFKPTMTTQVVCGWKCAASLADKNAEKKKIAEQRKADREERAWIRKEKERLKTYSQLANEAEAAVRRYIRARDYGKPCISCGTTKGVQFAAGHYKTSGGHPELRFNVLNIHRQCNEYCNRQLSGNINGNKHSVGYTQGLTDRFGEWIVEYLNSHHELKNYSRDDLNRIKKIFNKRALFYEKRRK